MANLPDRVAALEQDLADLAEIIGYGKASHYTSPGDNLALKIAAHYRPVSESTTVAESTERCLKKRKPDQDEDGEVCLLSKSHDGGHMFGPLPKVAATP